MERSLWLSLQKIKASGGLLLRLIWDSVCVYRFGSWYVLCDSIINGKESAMIWCNVFHRYECLLLNIIMLKKIWTINRSQFSTAWNTEWMLSIIVLNRRNSIPSQYKPITHHHKHGVLQWILFRSINNVEQKLCMASWPHKKLGLTPQLTPGTDRDRCCSLLPKQRTKKLNWKIHLQIQPCNQRIMTHNYYIRADKEKSICTNEREIK